MTDSHADHAMGQPIKQQDDAMRWSTMTEQDNLLSTGNWQWQLATACHVPGTSPKPQQNSIRHSLGWLHREHCQIQQINKHHATDEHHERRIRKPTKYNKPRHDARTVISCVKKPASTSTTDALLQEYMFIQPRHNSLSPNQGAV